MDHRTALRHIREARDVGSVEAASRMLEALLKENARRCAPGQAGQHRISLWERE